MSFQNVSLGSMILPPRLTRIGAPAASVAGLNTTTLADGAFVYCVENRGGYQLERTSAVAADGNTVIAPTTGPGRWLLKLGPGGGAGTVPRFTVAVFVDSGTAVPVADQNGSASAPYSTIQAAINANPGFTALMLVAASYPENVVVPAGTLVGFFPIVLASLTSLTLDGNALVFGGQLACGDMAVNAGVQFDGLSSVAVSGTLTLGDGAIFNSYLTCSLADVVLGESCVLNLINSFTISGTVSSAGLAGTISLKGSNEADSELGITTCIVSDVSASGYTCQVLGTVCSGNISAQKCAFTESKILANVTTGEMFVRDTTIKDPAAITTTGRVQIIGSNVDAATWANAVGQSFELDSFSNYWIKVNGTVLSNPGEKVITSDIVP